MTNEKKAKELAEDNEKSYIMYDGETETTSYNECYQAAIEMAEWKDKQFQEEKKQLVESIIEWIKENNGVYWRAWMDDSGDFYRGDLMDNFYDDLRLFVKKGE